MRKLVENITIGSDPEVFLLGEDGKYKSSIGKIGGTKVSPKPITDKGHAVQEDNVLAEFNIPPCKTAQELIDNIAVCMDWLSTNLTPLKPTVVASGHFDPSELNHPNAKEAGCDPDFNVWLGGTQNDKPSLKGKTLRSAGGHVLIGYNNPDIFTSFELLKLFDLFLGIPSVIYDKDTERRSLYGKAGCFRIKEFGFEYRTLSNVWIKSPEMITWLYNNVMDAINYYNSGKSIDTVDFELIQETINTSNTELALQLINKYGINVPVIINELTK
jgi:hypothetical protein